jgi:hypothetical protein
MKTWRIAQLLLAACCSVVAAAAMATGNTEGSLDTGELGARWWQHVVSIPAPQNPLLDETGANCGLGQNGGVWFLHGSFGNPLGQPIERKCTIPAGKTIFVPILNWLCVPYPGETVAQNKQICDELNDLTDVHRLRIDGDTRDDLVRRRASNRAFALPIPDDNILGYPADVFIAVHDGYFALIPPLSPGYHTIRVQGGVTSFGFTVDVRYRIKVVTPTATLPFVP